MDRRTNGCNLPGFVAASAEADQLGSPRVTAAHVLLALLRGGHDASMRALCNAMQFDIETLRRKLEELERGG